MHRFFFSIQNPSTSDATKGTFGIDLSLSFNPSENEAPTLVMKLTQEIERQAKNQKKLDLYKLYRTKIPLESLTELREVNESLVILLKQKISQIFLFLGNQH